MKDKAETVHLIAKTLRWAWPMAEEVGLGELLTPHLPDAPVWTEDDIARALTHLLAELITEGWDRYGAPTAARHPTEEGRWVGSFEGPGKPYTVEASSKREAYRLARREWVRRLLDRTQADKGAD